MSTKRRIAKAGVAAALAVGIFAGAAGPAAAASWKGISGTVYSGGSWFISSNDRYKEGTGSVQAKFSTLPKAGISFKIVNSSYATIGGTQHWTNAETDVARTLASSVANSTKFYTAFKQYSGCTGCSPYNFTGSLYY